VFWSVVVDVCSVCIGEVIIETVCVLTLALMVLRFHLTLWRLDDVYFHFCERVYDLE
jgi:hypothetical protein